MYDISKDQNIQLSCRIKKIHWSVDTILQSNYNQIWDIIYLINFYCDAVDLDIQ